MPVHQSDPNRKPDSAFVAGDLSFLVAGNECRLLDGRRTPGVIESIDKTTGLFRWRIHAFEDKGKSWDVPLEGVKRYQFDPTSSRCSDSDVEDLRQVVARLSQPLMIPADPSVRERTEQEIGRTEVAASQWLSRESAFFASGEALPLHSREGSATLTADLERYLFAQAAELARIETATADALVLNPSSGEWIKGVLIVMAEMGLAGFSGTIVRTPGLFDGLGSRILRQAYLMHRLAFVRAVFRKAGYEEVTVYRGMSSESRWIDRPRSILSCTFSLRVARSFASFDSESPCKTSYLMKLSVPIERLWMTHCETRALNGRYREAEVPAINYQIGPFSTPDWG